METTSAPKNARRPLRQDQCGACGAQEMKGYKWRNNGKD